MAFLFAVTESLSVEVIVCARSSHATKKFMLYGGLFCRFTGKPCSWSSATSADRSRFK